MDYLYANTTISFGRSKYLMEGVANGMDWNNAPRTILLGAMLFFVSSYIFQSIRRAVFEVKAPVIGYKHFWEPAWLVGVRFALGSGPMIRGGYEKFKDSMFKIPRNDTDILVLSHKYVNELRDMPESKVSPTEATLKNLVAPYTVGNVDLIRKSDIHRRVTQQKLTPSLGTLIPPIKDELDYALKLAIPECDDWTSVHVNEIIANIVSRVSARIFVGPALCRNEEWLALSVKFTRNVGMTRNMVRILPTFLRPLLAPLMKSYWGIYANLAAAQKLIIPIIKERQANVLNDPTYEKPNDFLQWMLDDAKPHESYHKDLAHRQLMIGLAAIHTTSMSGSHFIYDLCAHPEYAPALREEIVSVLREDGGWRKTTLNKLRKMDSFIKESQRMNPPFFLSFQRVARTPLTLSDGTYIPAGTHFAMASDAVLHDQANLPGGGDPEDFDPFRYSRLREDPLKPENLNRYQFAMSDSNHLHFGHGKYACPGRFFASNEVKIILCHLLMAYDFKFPPGQGRPKNLSYEEAQYPDPSVFTLIKKRTLTEAEAEIAPFVNMTA